MKRLQILPSPTLCPEVESGFSCNRARGLLYKVFTPDSYKNLGGVRRVFVRVCSCESLLPFRPSRKKHFNIIELRDKDTKLLNYSRFFS